MCLKPNQDMTRGAYLKRQALEDYIMAGSERYGLGLMPGWRRQTDRLPPANEQYFEHRQVLVRKTPRAKDAIEVAAKTAEQEEITLETLRKRALRE